MAEDSDLEKTEPATPKRIEKSREDGQVARSQELTTFTVLMASAAGVWFMGNKLIDDLLSIVKNGMQLNRELAFGRKSPRHDVHLMTSCFEILPVRSMSHSQRGHLTCAEPPVGS